MAAHQLALAAIPAAVGATRTKAGTVDAVIAAYYTSNAFTKGGTQYTGDASKHSSNAFASSTARRTLCNWSRVTLRSCSRTKRHTRNATG